MKYRELLQEYKNGTLDENKAAEVELDIEKQDAISEYLFENAEIPGIDEFSDSDVTDNSEGEKVFDNNADAKQSSIQIDEKLREDADDFSKLINKKIRMAFVKAGVITAAVSIIIVLFVIFALPKIVDRFYYNPGEAVAFPKEEGYEPTKRLDLDMMTYYDVFLPWKSYMRAESVSMGYGKYFINYRDITDNHVGTIEKNKMILFDPDSLRNTAQAYVMGSNEGKSKLVLLSPGNVCYEYDPLPELNDDDDYYASVTLNRCMKYDDFIEWCDDNGVYPRWVAYSTYVRDNNPEKLPIRESKEELEEHVFSDGEECLGFHLNEGNYIFYDKEKYPLLTAGDAMDASEDGLRDYDVAVTHVKSMLTYLDDNPQFLHMLQGDLMISPEYVKKNIDEYGLYIYGFVTEKATKEELMAIKEFEDVEFVMADPE